MQAGFTCRVQMQRGVHTTEEVRAASMAAADRLAAEARSLDGGGYACQPSGRPSSSVLCGSAKSMAPSSTPAVHAKTGTG